MIRDNSLKILTEEFIALTDIMSEQFVLVGKHLEQSITPEELKKVRENEKNIDFMENKIRETVINDIVRLTPRAIDLRRMVSTLNIIVDIERMGDILNSICKRLPIIIESKSVWKKYQPKLISLFGMVSKMFDNIVYALHTENNYIARNIIATYDSIDESYHEIHQMLFQKDVKAAEMPAYLNLSRILYFMERIGDSCTNIAEDLLYLTEGINARHTDIDS